MPRAATIAVLTTLAAQVVGAWANAASAEDRYGPPSTPNINPTPIATSTAGWLNWSGKSASAAAATRDIAPAPTRQPRPAVWTPPARTIAPAASSAGDNQPPRYYSVHREFGLTPDPIPLPAQFFADAASADLAAPPPPLPPRPVPGTQAATSPANTPANRARAVELQTADSAAY